MINKTSSYFSRLDKNEKGGNSKGKPIGEAKHKEKTDEEDLLLCKACLNVITKESERIAMGGSFNHTFANPEGIVYDICCFKTARGCGQIGPSTAHFTWFKGYEWRIAVCSACLNHLGWHFISPAGSSFYGLITGNLLSSSRKT